MNKKRFATILAALGIALAGLGANPMPTNADISICGGNIATDVYTGWNFDMVGAQYHKRFCGNSVNVIAVPNLGAYVGLNNSISSLKNFNMGTHRGIKLYDGTNYTGSWVSYCGDGNVPNISTASPYMNDRASSLKSFSC